MNVLSDVRAPHLDDPILTGSTPPLLGTTKLTLQPWADSLPGYARQKRPPLRVMSLRVMVPLHSTLRPVGSPLDRSPLHMTPLANLVLPNVSAMNRLALVTHSPNPLRLMSDERLMPGLLVRWVMSMAPELVSLVTLLRTLSVRWLVSMSDIRHCDVPPVSRDGTVLNSTDNVLDGSTPRKLLLHRETTVCPIPLILRRPPACRSVLMVRGTLFMSTQRWKLCTSPWPALLFSVTLAVKVLCSKGIAVILFPVYRNLLQLTGRTRICLLLSGTSTFSAPPCTETRDFALIQLHWLLVIRSPTVRCVPGYNRILLNITRDRSLRSSVEHRNRSCRNRQLRLDMLLKSLNILGGVAEKLMTTRSRHLRLVNLPMMADPFMCWVFLINSVASFRDCSPYLDSVLRTPCPNTSLSSRWPTCPLKLHHIRHSYPPQLRPLRPSYPL